MEGPHEREDPADRDPRVVGARGERIPHRQVEREPDPRGPGCQPHAVRGPLALGAEAVPKIRLLLGRFGRIPDSSKSSSCGGQPLFCEDVRY